MTNKEITRTIKNTIKLVKQNNKVNNLIIITNILEIQLELNELQRENERLKHTLEVRESHYNSFVEKVEEIQHENEKLYILKKYLHIENWQEDEEKTIQEVKCDLNSTDEDFYKVKELLDNECNGM